MGWAQMPLLLPAASESQRRYQGPVAWLPRITGLRPPSLPAGPAPRTSALHRAAGSTRGRSRPRPAPPLQEASSTGLQAAPSVFTRAYRAWGRLEGWDRLTGKSWTLCD
jgi:hypothetical protein